MNKAIAFLQKQTRAVKKMARAAYPHLKAKEAYKRFEATLSIKRGDTIVDRRKRVIGAVTHVSKPKTAS